MFVLQLYISNEKSETFFNYYLDKAPLSSIEIDYLGPHADTFNLKHHYKHGYSIISSILTEILVPCGYMKNCWIISNCNISSQFKLLKGEQNFKERFLVVNEPSGPRALWMFPVKSLRFKSWHRESPDTVLVQWRKGELSTAQRVDHVCCISMYSLNSSCFPLIDIWELPLCFINSPGNLYLSRGLICHSIIMFWKIIRWKI